MSRASGANPHSELIQAACNALIQTVAHGFRVVFVDDEDGQRVRSDYASELERLDLMPDLASKWPDAILLSDEETAVWFIDAVTSDGEIDGPRADALKKWAREKGYDTAGLTTAYKTWARLATRQTTYRNLALGSTVWIAEDGGKLLTVGALVP